MYFDFRTYGKAFWLVLSDVPSLRRLAFQIPILLILSMWSLANALFLALDWLFIPGYRKVSVDVPVFIVGSARSGTTFFHRLLCGDEEHFVAFCTWELLLPAIVQRKLVLGLTHLYRRLFPQSFARLVEKEKLQFQDVKAIRPFGINQPDEDDFLLLLSFSSSMLEVFLPYPEELLHLDVFELRPLHARRRILSFYRACVKRHLYLDGKGRTLLSKNPAFVSKIRDLAREFPDAKFIYPVRDPLETIPSLVHLLAGIWEKLGIDRARIAEAKRALVRGSIRDYHFALEALAELSADRCAIVRYTDLVSDPKHTVEQVYERLGLELSPQFAKRLSAEKKRQQGFKSVHEYSLDELGLPAEEVRAQLIPIYERFGLSTEALSADASGRSKV